MHAAIRVFSRHGVDGAKMEYIAKEAGIGKGTIYEYFASKERLFEEMLKFCMEEFCLGLKKAMDQGETLAEKLQYCSHYNAEYLIDHMDIVEIAMQVNLLSEELRVQFLAGQAAIRAHYMAMVKEAKVKAELRVDLDDELATFCIIGALDEFCKQRVFIDQRPLAEIDHRGIVDMILRGLKD
ncbi:MAG: helix-turn-helix domain-containing protein [Bacillota bacterium]|nr:helix-turn-helix domain-containing protein [Bacillota bacterium]